MRRFERFESRLPDLLGDLAAPRLPDYTDDLLARTAVTRQRPRWTFIERWLPMGVLVRRSLYVPRVPWRPLVVAAVLLALLAATLVWVGSQRRAPAPFGPARNGLVVYAADGDLHSWDPLTGATSTVVSGPSNDFTAGYSRDGTRLAFLRMEREETDSLPELISIHVADADGSNPVDLTGPLVAPDWWDWSAAGDSIVFQATVGPTPRLHVVATDGSAAPRLVDVGMAATFPSWLPPAGAEIVFRGVTRTDGALHSGLFAVRPDGTGLRPVTPTDGDAQFGYEMPMPSPDGTSLLYQVWDPVREVATIHRLDLRSGEDDALRLAPGRHGEGDAKLSPDSSLIAFRSFEPGGFRLWVVPADGSAAARPLSGITTGDSWYEFSPDSRTVMLNVFGRMTLLIDVESGDRETFHEAVVQPAGWQRRAP